MEITRKPGQQSRLEVEFRQDPLSGPELSTFENVTSVALGEGCLVFMQTVNGNPQTRGLRLDLCGDWRWY